MRRALIWFCLVCWPAWGEAPLSMDWLLGKLHDAHPVTIEQLLAEFPPASLQRHLFVYGSESQQAASFAFPRVIVHNDDASFILAFNGQPGSAGYFDLEILHFVRGESRFQPEVIHFDPQGKHAPEVDRHPVICAQCHQDDVRPNWDPYFHWVGFYGSEDDNYDAHTGAPILYGPEALAWQEFQKHQAGHPRYRFLPTNPAARPNLCFNTRVVVLNARRVLRNLAALPGSGRLLPALDRRYPELTIDQAKIPEDWIAQASRPWQQVVWDTDAGIRAAMQRRADRHVALTGWGPVGRVADQMQLMASGVALDANTSFSGELSFNAGLRYVFEELGHQPFAPLTTSRHPDYQLNLGTSEAMQTLSAGARVENGQLVFDDSLEVPPGQYDPCLE